MADDGYFLPLAFGKIYVEGLPHLVGYAGMDKAAFFGPLGLVIPAIDGSQADGRFHKIPAFYQGARLFEGHSHKGFPPAKGIPGCEGNGHGHSQAILAGADAGPGEPALVGNHLYPFRDAGKQAVINPPGAFHRQKSSSPRKSSTSSISPAWCPIRPSLVI